jgi:hypothetical protein
VAGVFVPNSNLLLLEGTCLECPVLTLSGAPILACCDAVARGGADGGAPAPRAELGMPSIPDACLPAGVDTFV